MILSFVGLAVGYFLFLVVMATVCFGGEPGTGKLSLRTRLTLFLLVGIGIFVAMTAWAVLAVNCPPEMRLKSPTQGFGGVRSYAGQDWAMETADRVNDDVGAQELVEFLKSKRGGTETIMVAPDWKVMRQTYRYPFPWSEIYQCVSCHSKKPQSDFFLDALSE